MNKKYQLDREYSVGEIIQYNLRMWWLALIFAVACAALLGGYKFVSTYPFLEKENYENIQQAATSLYVKNYNEESTVERVNNIIKIANSYRAYEMLTEKTGYVMDYESYKLLFSVEQGEASDVATVYFTYPASAGGFSISDDGEALAFLDTIVEVVDELSTEMIGESCVTVLDAPYVTSQLREVESYFITKDDFKKGVLKGATAGFILGIIVEIVLYTFWMLLYRKPKNAEEVRQCVDAPVIDMIKDKDDNEEETFKKVALFLKGEEKGSLDTSCVSISCILAQCPKKDVALKLAMSCANEQKKTLFIDLAAEGEGSEHSISSYILGDGKQPKPLAMNGYLDKVSRSSSDEKGFNIVMNKRFEEYLSEKRKEYEYIIIGSADVSVKADAYAAAKLCDRSFLVCGRKTVKNETLYRVKNTAEVNGIRIEGVLIYEL